MIRIEQLAEAALAGDALLLRSLKQDWLRENLRLFEVPVPVTHDTAVLSLAAGLVELLAERRGESSPSWTEKIGTAPYPIHLLKAAQTMRRLRELCETQSPMPLRKRNLFAPPTFLESV